MAKVTKAQEKAAQVLENKKTAFFRKVRTLVGHDLFGRWNKEIPLAFERGETADAIAAHIASQEPVGKALHPQKVDAIESADKNTRKFLDGILAKIAENDGDLYKAFPYPKYNDYSDAGRRGRDMHNLASMITQNTSKEIGYFPMRGMTYKRVKDDERYEREVNDARRAAAFDYDAFIIKMVGKVGPVVDASIDGSHIWSYSILSVVKNDGSKQNWKTQTILNFSKFGRPFNQWPSRKVK